MEASNPLEATVMLTIFLILVILWFLGLLGHIGGGLINLLLIAALIAIILHFIDTSPRT